MTSNSKSKIENPKSKKPSFSPTKFSSYLRCPLQYHYTYIQKLSKFYGRARAGTALGSSLHRTLQTLSEQGGTDAVSQEQLLNKFHETWQSKGYSSLKEELAHLEAGRAIVQEFYASATEEKRETLLTEKMLKQDRGGYILTGKIDRLDRLPDGTLEVVDYKSGKMNLEPEEVEGNLGLMAYETLVRSKYPDTPVRVALYALRINKKISILRPPEESAAIEHFLDSLAEQIINGEQTWEVFPARPIEGCPDCDYLRICAAYRKRGYPLVTENPEL